MKLTRQISRTVIVATVALMTGSVTRAAEDENTEVKQALDMTGFLSMFIGLIVFVIASLTAR